MAQIPAPENCPHCLNRGSATFGKGVCGITQVEKTIYDAPLSWQGQPLPFQPQAHYAEGAVITVSSRLTAHHKGHFEMYACADLSPSQGCFNKHPLAFVEDMLYGAPPDPSYPGRAYVAPNNGQAANGRLHHQGHQGNALQAQVAPADGRDGQRHPAVAVHHRQQLQPFGLSLV